MLALENKYTNTKILFNFSNFFKDIFVVVVAFYSNLFFFSNFFNDIVVVAAALLF